MSLAHITVGLLLCRIWRVKFLPLVRGWGWDDGTSSTGISDRLFFETLHHHQTYQWQIHRFLLIIKIHTKH